MVIEIHSCVLHVVTDNRGTLPPELRQFNDKVLLYVEMLGKSY